MILTKCAGCGQAVFEGDEIFEFEEFTIHQDSECCYSFISQNGISREAGGEEDDCYDILD